jgi:hypothetical protein
MTTEGPWQGGWQGPWQGPWQQEKEEEEEEVKEEVEVKELEVDGFINSIINSKEISYHSLNHEDKKIADEQAELAFEKLLNKIS